MDITYICKHHSKQNHFMKVIKYIGLLLLFMLLNNLNAQTITSQKEQNISIPSFDDFPIFGTLLQPYKNKPMPLVIIIAGSGATDRNGNQVLMQNNALKYLAEGLNKKKIASFRFDKRGIGKSVKGTLDESALRFENYVQDVQALIRFFKSQDRFSSVSVIGHSEGSLIGMIAARQEKADAFISIAGVGRTADKILSEQLKTQPNQEKITAILDSLKQGFLVEDIGNMKALFRKSVQPYLISWFKYAPQKEIARLNMPILLLQGDNDIQVKVLDAELLHKAQPYSELLIVPKMNHVLKIVEGDFTENLKSYYNPKLKISKDLVKSCSRFIHAL